MHSAPFKAFLPPSSCLSSSSSSSRFLNPNPSFIRLKRLLRPNEAVFLLESLKCVCTSDSDLNSLSSCPLKSNARDPKPSVSCLASTESPPRISAVADRLQSLVSEFKSLSEPIDRVKRLLHYAALLPPFDESARVQANRVLGCTAQVWLEATVDADGAMRFTAGSDSEITKGFCWCLIWVLDGAAPEDVLSVNTEDLVDMNVGLAGRAHSRVNTWHNVLFSMQERAKALVRDRESNLQREHFSCLVATADDPTVEGSYAETKARFILKG